MSSAGACAFCRQRDADASTGQMLRTADGEITAHYNCTLFSPEVISVESGSENVFGGFDIETVKKAIRRASKLKCSKCNENGASVGCDIKQCKKTYHYECVEEADGKCIEDPENQIYIALCAEHKEQAKAANKNQLDEDSDISDPSTTSGQNKKKVKKRKHGRSKTERKIKKREGSNTTASPPPPALTESPKPESPTPESARRPTSIEQQLLQEMRADRGVAIEYYEQITAIAERQAKALEDLGATLAAGQDRLVGGMERMTLVLERMADAQERHNIFLEYLVERVNLQFSQAQSGLGVTVVEMSPETLSDESITEQIQEDEMVVEDKSAGDTVVTDEAPSFDHPFLEMPSDEQPVTNVPVYTIVSSPSRASPVIKLCTNEQPVGSSTNETNSARSLRGKTEEKKIMLRLRRLIPWLANITDTNDRSHMSSLDGSISTERCTDQPDAQFIEYVDENDTLTAQAIGCIGGKDRLAPQPIDSTYGEDMCLAQPVGSFNAEAIPVTKPNDLFNKSSHADPIGYIKRNRTLHEKSVVCPNDNMPFAVQLKQKIKFLNKQSAKISNTQVTPGTCPSASPLPQYIYDDKSGTLPLVSPCPQDVYGGTSETCSSASPLPQYIYDEKSGTCPLVSPCPQDVYGDTSETCPLASPLAQDVYGGTSGTCPSASPLAQDAHGDTSGTCPSASPLAQDVNVGTSGTCPSASPLAKDVYVGTSGTYPLVSPIAQDLHVEQQAMSLTSIYDTCLEDLPQAFRCPDVSTPETDKEAQHSRFISPEKISEMSAKLVSGALSKQFNFSTIAKQIKSPIRSAKSSLSHSRDGTSSASPSVRFRPSASQPESSLPETGIPQDTSKPPSAQTVSRPCLKQSDEHCLCYSTLENKVDSLQQEQERSLSFMEVQQSEVDLVLKSMMATPRDSAEMSCPSPPLPTSSLPGTQSPSDHDQ